MTNRGKNMGDEKKLLELLAGGEEFSGQWLADKLGITRAGIWKQIQKLSARGINILSSRTHGYCIPNGIELLCRDEIIASFGAGSELTFHIFDEIESTNDFLLNLSDCHQHVCISESQTQGRGRRGRVWVSPYGRFVYLSIGWTYDGGVAVAEGLSLAIGVAISDALEKMGVTDIRLKWPNDIFYENKKLGGVLIDVTGDPSGRFNVVVGVGINVHTSDNLQDDITQPYTDLEQIAGGKHLISRNKVAIQLVKEIKDLLSSYSINGFSDYKQQWLSKAAFVNNLVMIEQGNIRHEGVLVDISDKGALLLNCNGVLQEFHGGELSLRGLE